MTPTIIDFVRDAGLLGLAVSPAQETLLRAIYGLPLDRDQLELWRLCTGRELYPAQPFEEVTVLAGARAGKDSRIAVPIVLFEALFGGHQRRAARGEVPVIPLVAQDQRATRIAFDYLRSYLDQPLLRGEVLEVRATEVDLRNGVRVVCFPSTAPSLRGWSIPAAAMDEVAFFRLEGAVNADVEIQTSIRRGMIAFERTRLVKISTPYLRSGVLWQDFDRHYGTASPDLLVWKAPSALMNPSIRPERLERERRLDPLRFAREYLAEFAQDIAAAFDPVVIDQAIIRGRREQPREEGRRYHAFVDPSGGGADAFSLAVGHNEEGRAVIDLVRWWQGGSPAGHVEEVAGLLKSYGVSRATGDRYAGSWVADAFAKAGISYDQAERVKSDLYLELIAYLNSARVELLDLPRLRQELQNLERRPGPGGKDRIDHPIGHHDDTANAVAGVVHLLLHRRESFVGRAKTVVITHNRRAARVAEEQEFLMAFADPEKVKEARERRQKRLEASLRPGRGVPSRGFLR